MHTAISHYMTQFNQQDLCEADPFSDRLCVIWVKPWNRLSLFEGGFAHGWDWWTSHVSVSMDFNSTKMHVKSVKFLHKLVLTYWNTCVPVIYRNVTISILLVSFNQCIISRVNLELLLALLHLYTDKRTIIHAETQKKTRVWINSMVRSLVILYSSGI